MSKKPLINFNVPKAGRITTGRVVGVAASAAIIIAIWNWSEQIPGVGPYAALGKYYISRVLGVRYYSPKPAI